MRAKVMMKSPRVTKGKKGRKKVLTFFFFFFGKTLYKREEWTSCHPASLVFSRVILKRKSDATMGPGTSKGLPCTSVMAPNPRDSIPRTLAPTPNPSQEPRCSSGAPQGHFGLPEDTLGGYKTTAGRGATGPPVGGGRSDGQAPSVGGTEEPQQRIKGQQPLSFSYLFRSWPHPQLCAPHSSVSCWLPSIIATGHNCVYGFSARLRHRLEDVSSGR